ncbi:MAG: FKBP-type peptidyl-prolyl cis-trans isomerase [Rickettsiales bacterium]|jgi:trigger factor|nr:FKBP-type peptidyl-prolyl cis-trans isomerase [Rickettsiales bacterium]
MKKILSIIICAAFTFACGQSDAKTAKMGDTVVIDFVGYLNGDTFPGGSAEKYPLMLGSNAFVPGFESQLVGTKPGDEKDVNVVFPMNYYPDLAGKSVVFKVKVREVK